MTNRERELDAALRDLAVAEPPEGFESRLLARLAAEAPARRLPRRRWTALALASAALALVALLTIPRPAQRLQPVAHAAPHLAPPLRVAASWTPRRSRHSVPRRAFARWRFPAQFPSPAPPSAEERALLRFVRGAPPAELAAYADGPDIAPLKAAAIAVPPLAPPPGETQP